LPAPLFFELDTLVNRVTLTKKTRQDRNTAQSTGTHMIFPTSSSASFNDSIISLHSSTPACYRHDDMRSRRRDTVDKAREALEVEEREELF